jgi:hypothetical protein
LSIFAVNSKKQSKVDMAPADQKAIAIDLIGIAPSYQG